MKGTSPGSQAVEGWDGPGWNHRGYALPAPWMWGCSDKAVPDAARLRLLFGQTMEGKGWWEGASEVWWPDNFV